MTKKCQIISRKTIIAGNYVSYSNHKIKRRFVPNLKNYLLFSNVLKCFIKLRIATHSVKAIECNYGLDNFLLRADNKELTVQAIQIKRRIKKTLK